MVNPFKEKIKALKSIQARAGAIARAEIRSERDYIAYLNRSQLNKGIKSDGSYMPNYTSKSKKSGRIKLYDRGKFHSGIKPIFSKSGGISLKSTDWKFVGNSKWVGGLPTKYGEFIMGLTAENIKLLTDKVKPRIIEQIKKLL